MERPAVRRMTEGKADSREKARGWERVRQIGHMNNRQEGTSYEREAGALLEQEGYEVLQYNFRCRQAEIDIVAREGQYLVFIEVKGRRSRRNGMPEEAVGRRKQERIRRAALYYLARFRVPESTPVRFDVAAVDEEGFRLIRNAFLF